MSKPEDTLGTVTLVVASLNEVIAALREEVVALATSERKSRQRIAGYLALLGIVLVGSVFGVGITYRQGQNVKSIVHYISDCQRPEGVCKQRNDAAISQAVKGISVAVFDSMTCVLKVAPDRRTDADVKACRDKYFGG